MVLSAPGAYVWCFGVAGRDLLLYVRGDGRSALTLDLPPGSWRTEWIDVKTGARIRANVAATAGGPVVLDVPTYEVDIALRLRRER